ncbi:hypothetical protein Tco_0224989 [Tanacetum coccineum]
MCKTNFDVIRQTLMAWGGETTTGYKAYDENVEIPGEHLNDQDGVVAELSDGELKVLFPFASEKGRIDDSFSVEWEKVDI